jgi:hypothetical protein
VKKEKILAVGQILPGVFEDISRGNMHEQIQLEKIWLDIASAVMGAGTDTAGAGLSGFKEGVVYIAVDSSARLFYWKLRRGAVLKRFQERRPDVKNIVFKIGKVT